MDFDYTTMHKDSMTITKYQTLKACWAILQLFTSVKSEQVGIQQDGISKGYSMDPRDSVEETKAKSWLFKIALFKKLLYFHW